MSEQAIPAHIGFIMDGNRRWAKQHGKPIFEGHFAGQKVLRDAVFHAAERGVKYMSAYAFSTENWSRTEEEVGYLMGQVAKAFLTYSDELVEQGIRTIILGVRDKLSKKVIETIEKVERKTAGGQKATFAVCFNYGGQLEIAEAVRNIVRQGLPVEDIDEACISANIAHPEIPPVDLVIRTSGEQRLSGFMLWRAAYSEFIFRKEYWPDFTVDVLDECLLEYSERQRRFGG